jgi:hypothetical protein
MSSKRLVSAENGHCCDEDDLVGENAEVPPSSANGEVFQVMDITERQVKDLLAAIKPRVAGCSTRRGKGEKKQLSPQQEHLVGSMNFQLFRTIVKPKRLTGEDVRIQWTGARRKELSRRRQSPLAIEMSMLFEEIPNLEADWKKVPPFFVVRPKQREYFPEFLRRIKSGELLTWRQTKAFLGAIPFPDQFPDELSDAYTSARRADIAAAWLKVASASKIRESYIKPEVIEELLELLLDSIREDNDLRGLERHFYGSMTVAAREAIERGKDPLKFMRQKAEQVANLSKRMSSLSNAEKPHHQAQVNEPE